MVGEELVVSVEREGHNYVNLYVDSKYRASGYPESSGSSSSETRTVLTSSDVGDRTVSVTVWVFDKNTKASTSTTETFTISVEAAPSVSLNDTFFTVYDTLEVTVSKSDLYYASMSINGVYADGSYASGNTSMTLQKTFDSDDAGGYLEVVVTVSYGSGGQQTTTYTEYVFFQDFQ